MVDNEIRDDTDPEDPSEWNSMGLSALLIRLQSAGLAVEKVAEEYGTRLVVKLPNGRGHRNISIFEHQVDKYDSIPLPTLRFLGDFDAIIDTASGVIEAALVSTAGLSMARRLAQLPGVESLDEEFSAINVDGEELAEDTVGRSRTIPSRWRIILQRDATVIEVSPPSHTFGQIVGMSPATVKVRGATTSSDAEALELLNATVLAALFDLDLCYDIPLDLRQRRPRPLRVSSRSRPTVPPSFPTNRYAPEALALYRYGRSARGLPLLEFLAYYQVVEFFFPIFTREQLIKQLRISLRDPRFNPNDDVAMGQIISLLQPRGKATMSEKEQLRVAIRACVDAEFIERLITSSEDAKGHFCDKRLIKGVEHLSLTRGTPDIRDQLADRMYAIRCRVVHTKQDGGDPGIELLLPSSPEAKALSPDIDLARVIAQKALIAGAGPLI